MTLVVAHRGAWGPAPQNSLAAFEAAIALGADAVELDVRPTADGRIVAVHDARIKGRLVRTQSHEQLQGRLAPGQAPALEEVIDMTAGRILLDVELKEAACARQVMTILAGRLEPGQYVVTSFRDAALAAVSRTVPEARTGLLVGSRRRLRELEQRLRRTRASFLAPHTSLARNGLLAWAAERELPCWVWTVNDRRRLASLTADPRVAAVITDRPQRALTAR